MAGLTYSRDTVIHRLREVGCTVIEPGGEGAAPATEAVGLPKPAAAAPERRPEPARAARGRQARKRADCPHRHPAVLAADLRHPGDLAEEVIRLEGYDNVPVRMPGPPPGAG